MHVHFLLSYFFPLQTSHLTDFQMLSFFPFPLEAGGRREIAVFFFGGWVKQTEVFCESYTFLESPMLTIHVLS